MVNITVATPEVNVTVEVPPPNSGDDMSDDDDSAEETTATGQAYVYFTGNAGPVGLMLGSEDNAPAGMWGILIVGEPNKTVSVSMTFTGLVDTDPGEANGYLPGEENGLAVSDLVSTCSLVNNIGPSNMDADQTPTSSGQLEFNLKPYLVELNASGQATINPAIWCTPGALETLEPGLHASVAWKLGTWMAVRVTNADGDPMETFLVEDNQLPWDASWPSAWLDLYRPASPMVTVLPNINTPSGFNFFTAMDTEVLFVDVSTVGGETTVSDFVFQVATTDNAGSGWRGCANLGSAPGNFQLSSVSVGDFGSSVFYEINGVCIPPYTGWQSPVVVEVHNDGAMTVVNNATVTMTVEMWTLWASSANDDAIQVNLVGMTATDSNGNGVPIMGLPANGEPVSF
ncbi:MAG: hypothetical protein AAB886_02015 [Patescibacteria group bacterium]